MEKHHLLRRDPSWHPNGCNLCGQLGHQAANCPTGTINWRDVYGDEAFVLKGPIYFSDILAREKYKEKQKENLEQRARDYAKGQATAAGLNWDEIEATGARLRAAEPSDVIKPVVVPQPAAVEAAPSADALPPGWAVAHDANNKPYYWHRKTQKVQWDRPTDSTPI